MLAKTSGESFLDNGAGKALSAHIEKADSSPSSEAGEVASDDPFAVTLDPSEDPKNLPNWRKWSIVLILASGAHCTACVSAVVSVAFLERIYSNLHGGKFSQGAFTVDVLSEEFHVSEEVAILGVSLFVLGLGMMFLLLRQFLHLICPRCEAMGPLFIGPLSEVQGRNMMYRVSYLLFFVFSWPVAFPPNIGAYARLCAIHLTILILCGTQRYF